MTRRTRTAREAANRLDTLEADDGHADEIFVVRIGGDPDKPRGWLTPEEYEQHYGDRPESAFTFNVNGDKVDS